MIYIDLPVRDLVALLVSIEGVTVIDAVERLPHLGTAAEANTALVNTDDRLRTVARGAPTAERHALLCDALATTTGSGEIAITTWLGHGFRSWVRVRAVAAEPAWLETLLASQTGIVLIAADDGSAAVRVRRHAFTDGTQALSVWSFPDAATEAPGWHAAARAALEARHERAWIEGEAVLRANSFIAHWRRAQEANLPTPGSLHRVLARYWDVPAADRAMMTWRDRAGDPRRAEWLRAALDRLGVGTGCFVAFGPGASGWFFVEPRDPHAWLITLHGAALSAGSLIASGWTHTAKNLVIARADRTRAWITGESEYEEQSCWIDVPPR